MIRFKIRRGRRKKANWLFYGLAAFLFLLAFIWAYVFLFQRSNSAPQTGEGEVAIIDQLSTTHPNTTFWHAAQSIFNEQRLKAYYFQGSSVTVGFYRGLPSRGFSLIILRAHSAVWLDTGKLVLFTNEKWSDSEAYTTYLADIMADILFYCFSASIIFQSSTFVFSSSVRFFAISLDSHRVSEDFSLSISSSVTLLHFV